MTSNPYYDNFTNVPSDTYLNGNGFGAYDYPFRDGLDDVVQQSKALSVDDNHIPQPMASSLANVDPSLVLRSNENLASLSTSSPSMFPHEGNGASTAPPAGPVPADAAFWDMENELYSRYGRCSGPNRVLCRQYEELQPIIWAQHHDWCAQNLKPSPNAHVQTQKMRGNPFVVYTGDEDSFGIGESQAYTPTPETQRQMLPNYTPNSKGKARAQEAVVFEPVGIQPVAESVAIVPHSPDPELDSAAACRQYLAYVDPREAHILAIDGDDWQTVKQHRVQEFEGLLFNALTHQYASDPPSFANLNEVQNAKYIDQQRQAQVDVVAMLQTPVQVKRAKARCQLLVHAVIAFSEKGVPRELFENHQSYVKRQLEPKRNGFLDKKLICSQRLHKIVEMVKSYKLVACDVVEGNNFEWLTQDPDSFLKTKINYLKSNVTRQKKYDTQKGKELEPPSGNGKKQTRPSKRKRKAAEAEFSEDSDEGWDHEMSLAKEKRATRSSARKRA